MRILFKIRVGSHLYGLNNENSDEDFLSVFIPDREEIFGLEEIDFVDRSTKTSDVNRKNSKNDVDDKSYSLKKYIHLLLKNNPNILETLFVSRKNIISSSEEYETLRSNYNKFVTTKVFESFFGYAVTQKKKLEEKRIRLNQLKNALSFLDNIILINHRVDVLTEVEAHTLSLKIPYLKGKVKSNVKHLHKGMSISLIRKVLSDELDQYGWRTNSFSKLGYDVKFAYNLIRVMEEGSELLRTGKLEFPLKNRNNILSIKNGKMELSDVMAIYEQYEYILNKEKERTKLRVDPDYDWANRFLINSHVKHLKL